MLAGVAAISIVLPTLVHADSPLAGERLREAISGRTVTLDTPLGALPINYAADGTMRARALKLVQYTGSPHDNGTWWLAREKLCQRWRTWMDAKEQCFALRRDGDTIHWQASNGQTGTAVISR